MRLFLQIVHIMLDENTAIISYIEAADSSFFFLFLIYMRVFKRCVGKRCIIISHNVKLLYIIKGRNLYVKFMLLNSFILNRSQCWKPCHMIFFSPHYELLLHA